MKKINIVIIIVLIGMSVIGLGVREFMMTRTRPLTIQIQPVEGITDDFMKGVDISSLIEMEDFGQKYYDEKGEERDLFKILEDHDVNWVRVRLWNDPYDVPWTKDLSRTGEMIDGPVGGGTNDLPKTIELSQRAKNSNMKVLLDFHYSDFWADPGKQYMPKAWEGLTIDQLTVALYDFTYASLEALAKEKCLPDMVQIGNEINNGLVWPVGNDITSENAFRLLESGSKAVRDISKAYDHPMKVMIHLAEGGDRSVFVKAFDALTERGLDYDVIGLSFYPYWHGTLKDLQLNLKTLEERYGKELVVAELAYGYTVVDGDGDVTSNIFNEEMTLSGGYKASVQGQATFVRDVIETVTEVRNGKGMGVFYWEPAWLTPPSAGWMSTEGNGWENQAMFDTKGKALESLQVFSEVSKKATNNQAYEVTYKGVAPLTYPIDQGQKVFLPYRVQALFSDDHYEEMTVKWENLPLGYNETPGNYTVKGIIEDNGAIIEALISVIENHNILENGGFENEGTSLWTFDEGIFKLGKEGENPYTGYFAMNYWVAQDFSGSLTSLLTDIPDGAYELSVFVMGASLGTSDSYLYANNGAEYLKTKFEVTGFNDWKKVVIDQVLVQGGQLEIGLELDEAGGSWGWVDDFQLTPLK